MYKLPGEKDEKREITQYEAVDANTLDAAIGKLSSEKRDTRRSLIRSGHTLSGIVKHLGNDSKKLSETLEKTGIASTEKNQLIAIAQVEEFINPAYDLRLPNSIGPLYELCKSADQIELMDKTSFLDPSLTTAAIKKFAKLYAEDDGKSLQEQHDDQRREHEAKHGKSNEVPFKFKPTVDSNPSSDVTKRVIELRIDPTKYQNAAELEIAVKALETALTKAKLGDHVTTVTKNTAEDRAKWMKNPPKAKMTQEEKDKAALDKKLKNAQEKASTTIEMLKGTQSTGLGDEHQKKVLTQWLGRASARLLKTHDSGNAIHAHIERLKMESLYEASKAEKAKEKLKEIKGDADSIRMAASEEAAEKMEPWERGKRPFDEMGGDPE